MNSAEQSLRSPRDASQAARDLQFVDVSSRAARESAAAVWFPLLVIGIVTAAAPGAINLIPGDAAPAWYWAFAGPLIGTACAIFYSTRNIQLPARYTPLSLAVSVTIGAGSMVVASLSDGRVQDGAPVAVVSVGLAVFASLYRSALIGAVAGIHFLAAMLMMVTDSSSITDSATIAVGALTCTCGIIAVLRLEATAPIEP